MALGTHHWEKVDVVLSGVNLGPNLGNALWHSGTLAAAKQAALLGLRGIALSTPVVSEDPDLSPLEPFLARVLELLLPRSELKLVNVNLPPEPRGLCWTRQAVEQYAGQVVPGEDPMGRRHFWFTVVPLKEHEAGTDLWAHERGYISVTPLRLDLTNHAALRAAAGDEPMLDFDADRSGADGLPSLAWATSGQSMPISGKERAKPTSTS